MSSRPRGLRAAGFVDGRLARRSFQALYLIRPIARHSKSTYSIFSWRSICISIFWGPSVSALSFRSMI